MNKIKIDELLPYDNFLKIDQEMLCAVLFQIDKAIEKDDKIRNELDFDILETLMFQDFKIVFGDIFCDPKTGEIKTELLDDSLSCEYGSAFYSKTKSGSCVLKIERNHIDAVYPYITIKSIFSDVLNEKDLNRKFIRLIFHVCEIIKICLALSSFTPPKNHNYLIDDFIDYRMRLHKAFLHTPEMIDLVGGLIEEGDLPELP